VGESIFGAVQCLLQYAQSSGSESGCGTISARETISLSSAVEERTLEPSQKLTITWTSDMTMIHSLMIVTDNQRVCHHLSSQVEHTRLLKGI
jgi:hypothetical protein